jgi:hypothetical protein
MEGGLEAKIHEGGKQRIFSLHTSSHVVFPVLSLGSALRFLSALGTCARPVVPCPAVGVISSRRQHRGATRLAAGLPCVLLWP